MPLNSPVCAALHITKAEIADYVIAAIGSGKYDFIRLNFPNGDMVGHIGVFPVLTAKISG